MVATMKKASWILLTLLGIAITLISLVSASRAYNRADDYGSSGIRVSEIAGGREDVTTALRGIRGTAAAMAAAYGVLFLTIVLVPYRRGDVWAWWALLAGSTTVLVIVFAAHSDPRLDGRRRSGGHSIHFDNPGSFARRPPAEEIADASPTRAPS